MCRVGIWQCPGGFEETMWTPASSLTLVSSFENTDLVKRYFACLRVPIITNTHTPSSRYDFALGIPIPPSNSQQGPFKLQRRPTPEHTEQVRMNRLSICTGLAGRLLVKDFTISVLRVRQRLGLMNKTPMKDGMIQQLFNTSM